MNVQMMMALCILVFMVVMLLTHKLPYGVTAMICCVLFVLPECRFKNGLFRPFQQYHADDRTDDRCGKCLGKRV